MCVNMHVVDKHIVATYECTAYTYIYIMYVTECIYTHDYYTYIIHIHSYIHMYIQYLYIHIP